MQEKTHWYDYITTNIYWFGLTARAQVLSPLVVPLLVQRFVGEAVKGTYMGRIRLWSLMVALLTQALMGLLSDHSTLRWGRRRPFIFIGAIGEILVFALIAMTAKMTGMQGYWTLFGLYILSMIASNTAHGALQGLIPDLVPDELRGRFSGVKALLELPVPLIFASFVAAPLVSQGKIGTALFVLGVVMLVCMAITMLVHEERQEKAPFKLDWTPFVRLILMTVVFTLVILGMGWAIRHGATLFSNGLTGLAKQVIHIIFGVIGIAVTVGLGVWVSVALSIGGDIRENMPFTWWVTNRLAFLVASTNLAGFMLYFIQDRFVELSGEKAAGPAASVMLFVGIFILFTALPSGWLADRFGKKPMVLLAGLLAGLGTIVVVSIPSLTAIKIGGCFVGAGVGLFYSANWALGTEIVPKDQAARYLGISNLAGAGAGAIGAYIGGPIADEFGYVLLFIIYGAMFFLSTLTLAGIPEERKAG